MKQISKCKCKFVSIATTLLLIARIITIKLRSLLWQLYFRRIIQALKEIVITVRIMKSTLDNFLTNTLLEEMIICLIMIRISTKLNTNHADKIDASYFK